MAKNATDRLADSTQPVLSLACSWMVNFVWKEEYLTPTTFTMFTVVVCVEVPMCLVTILLNLLVMFAVWRKRYMKKQKPCFLLACLAATDLLVGAVVLPLTILSHIMRLTGLGPVCLVDFIAMENSYTVCGASLFNLMIISGERYLAIKHALRYQSLVTTRRLTIAAASAWTIPVFLTTAAHIEADNAALQDQIHNVVVLACIPLSVAVITFCQVAVFLESRRHLKDIRAHQVSEAAARQTLMKDKAARTTAMIVGALFLCYAPSTVYHMIIPGLENLSKSLTLGLAYVMGLLIYFNSLINPVIYCMRTRDFKRAFRELLNLGNAQLNQELEMHRIGNFARQQGNSKRTLEYSRKEARTPSRTRSLDLSTDSVQQQNTRRNNSI